MEINKKKLLKICKYFLVFIVSFFILHTVVAVIYGLNDSYEKSDLAIVYGNEVYKNQQISDRLKDRLDKCIELYGNKQCKYIILSGGIDKNGNDEAEIMKKYLIDDAGIPKEVIITDNSGYNTNATARFVKNYMINHNMQSAICISQYSHLARAVMSLYKSNIKIVGRAHANYRWQLSDFLTLPREFMGFYVYLIRNNV